MFPNDRRWVSCREFGEIFLLHPKSVASLVRRGALPYVRLPGVRGGRGAIRIDKRRFEELLESSEILSVSAPLDRRRKM